MTAMYTIKKIDGLHRVVCNTSGRIQFSSLMRANCRWWATKNETEKT